jgi:hypothetical protein
VGTRELDELISPLVALISLTSSVFDSPEPPQLSFPAPLHDEGGPIAGWVVLRVQLLSKSNRIQI